ncbi:hypothetical protein SEA_GIBBLES_17 [Gordonia phage Gibbles]|uniref:Uncharacterized protein n=3 Tax=Gordonia phage Orchid TaxID=1838075 RepID=A0A160DHA4_9CAUD|nr:tail completion or Neck1 protein [Gordonia phage Orchid]ANA87252.1 hypothetical protein PBI_PATRICKSTAR_18 [Gordonia phage PatrickStar]ANA87365.1 hypothetical protein PBI_ORCHID_18 [Gordonia phage Orchid]ANA87479.1 hypothetical protein PBI_KAMPE_18 [Gordonia phage Kampe]QDK01976.1 hypothetical protein SEA_GIBBLES_17 [Gordonia phage Gibbles]
MAVAKGKTVKANFRPVKDKLTTIEQGVSAHALIATMNSIHHYFVNKTENMFSAESDPFGNKWAPLAPATISRRSSLGFPPAPINVRTGKMKDYMTPSVPDVIGSGAFVSMAYPRRNAPPNDMLIRLKQAGGELKGPAREVVGMNETDVAYVISYVNASVLGELF